MGIPLSSLPPAWREKVKTSTRRGSFEFTIQGAPMGAPRMTRQDKWKQRDCVMRYRDWKDRARFAAGEMPSPETIESLSWTAFFRPPDSWSKKKRAASIGTQHRQKPDRDNIDKAVLDALFPDADQAIASGTIRKEWSECECLVVTVKMVEQESA